MHHVWRLSTSGGVPVVVRQLLHGLDPARFEQHVVSHRPDDPADGLDQLPATVTLHTLGVIGSPSVPARLRSAGRLARVVRSIDPDVVHTHSGIASNLLPWRTFVDRARTPSVLEVHDAGGTGRVSGGTDRLETLAMRRLRMTPLVHSSAVADDVARRTGRRPDPIPLGIDVAAFARDDAARARWRRGHGFVEDDVVVLYVARIVPTKNVPRFLDLAAVVSDTRATARFVVVGGGDVESANGQARARGLGPPAVRIAGYEPDLAAAYSGADVFVSTSEYEGFGIALVEAMAASLPVVSTRVGGTVDVVVDGVTGRLVDTDDELVAAVTGLVDDPSLRDAWGTAGRARAAARFAATRFVADVGDLYERLATR